MTGERSSPSAPMRHHIPKDRPRQVSATNPRTTQQTGIAKR